MLAELSIRWLLTGIQELDSQNSPQASYLIRCFTILGCAKVLVYNEQLGAGICLVERAYVTSFQLGL